MKPGSKLTRAARGQSCTLQIHPYCRDDEETTVFCHFNSEAKGVGNKSPDWWGADGCSTCHAIIDGHQKTDLPHSEITACMFRGLFRTWRRRIEQGLITIPGVK